MNTTPSLHAVPRDRVRVLEVMGNAIVGGMEAYVQRLVERLPQPPFEVSVLCRFDGPVTQAFRAAGIEVAFASMPDEQAAWPSLQTLCGIVRRRGIDVLHAHLANAHMLAGLAGRMTGTPVLTTIHSRTLTLHDLEVQRLAHTHLCTVCDDAYYHALNLGVPPSHLSCVPNGVDTNVFCPAPKPRDTPGTLRTALGLPADVPLVGFVGRLSPEKGPELFVRAALLLLHRMPEAHCVLVGDGPMQREMRDFIDRCHLGGQVHLAGVQFDMPAVYHDLDAVACTSHSEAMPLAVLEALACGVPVVATAVGAVPRIVQHGQTGWLAGPRDFDGVAQRLHEILTTPGQRDEMAERARAWALSQARLEDSVAKTAELLQSLVRRSEGLQPRHDTRSTAAAQS